MQRFPTFRTVHRQRGNLIYLAMGALSGQQLKRNHAKCQSKEKKDCCLNVFHLCSCYRHTVRKKLSRFFFARAFAFERTRWTVTEPMINEKGKTVDKESQDYSEENFYESSDCMGCRLVFSIAYRLSYLHKKELPANDRRGGNALPEPGKSRR